MKYLLLFSLKNNEPYLRMSCAAVVIGAKRVKLQFVYNFLRYMGSPLGFSRHLFHTAFLFILLQYLLLSLLLGSMFLSYKIVYEEMYKVSIYMSHGNG